MLVYFVKRTHVTYVDRNLKRTPNSVLCIINYYILYFLSIYEYIDT